MNRPESNPSHLLNPRHHIENGEWWLAKATGDNETVRKIAAFTLWAKTAELAEKRLASFLSDELYSDTRKKTITLSDFFDLTTTGEFEITEVRPLDDITIDVYEKTYNTGTVQLRTIGPIPPSND